MDADLALERRCFNLLNDKDEQITQLEVENQGLRAEKEAQEENRDLWVAHAERQEKELDQSTEECQALRVEKENCRDYHVHFNKLIELLENDPLWWLKIFREGRDGPRLYYKMQQQNHQVDCRANKAIAKEAVNDKILAQLRRDVSEHETKIEELEDEIEDLKANNLGTLHDHQKELTARDNQLREMKKARNERKAAIEEMRREQKGRILEYEQRIYDLDSDGQYEKLWQQQIDEAQKRLCISTALRNFARGAIKEKESHPSVLARHAEDEREGELEDKNNVEHDDAERSSCSIEKGGSTKKAAEDIFESTTRNILNEAAQLVDKLRGLTNDPKNKGLNLCTSALGCVERASISVIQTIKSATEHKDTSIKSVIALFSKISERYQTLRTFIPTLPTSGIDQNSDKRLVLQIRHECEKARKAMVEEIEGFPATAGVLTRREAQE